MKHGKRPTRAQKQLLKAWHNNPDNWLIVKDTPTEMVIVNRLSDKQRTIPKRRLD